MGTLVYVFEHDVSGVWARVQRRDGGVEGWIRRKHLARDSHILITDPGDSFRGTMGAWRKRYIHM